MISACKPGKKLLARLAVLSAMVVLSACNTTLPMDIPKVKLPDAPALDMPVHQQASFMLEKVIAGIKRGTTILHFPAPGTMGNVDGTMCNQKRTSEGTVDWRSGSRTFGNWSSELGEVFFEVLSGKGYNIQGDPTKLFRSQSETVAAEYLVGARIKEIRGNICQNHSLWDGRPLREFSGELYIKVEWRVYSVVLKKEILTVETEAYDILKTPKSSATNVLLNGAFENATEALLENKEFIALALRQNKIEDKSYVFKGSAVELPLLRQRTKNIKDRIAVVLGAVMTVRAGTGFGSGFAISKSGHILTNAHVVGKATRVSLKLSNGLEIEGRVLSVNERRDVALIKAAIRIPWALPIRKELPKPLEKVVVIGSPFLKSLQSTVTTGIISAMRLDPSGLTFIQSDAAISGGNSGGPMLDENGNVIGISVSSYIGARTQNLNNFIPINDALRALKITLVEVAD